MEMKNFIFPTKTCVTSLIDGAWQLYLQSQQGVIIMLVKLLSNSINNCSRQVDVRLFPTGFRVFQMD